MHVSELKDAILKGCILCDSVYVTSGKGETVQLVNRAVVARHWWRGIEQGKLEIYQGNETILYDVNFENQMKKYL